MSWVFDEDEDYERIPLKLKGVGKGHSKDGQRAKWKKKPYFEQDLLRLFDRTMPLARFKARFIYSPKEVRWFFNTIKRNVRRPKETLQHARNKYLLWLDKTHNCLSGNQMQEAYDIGVATAFSHVSDILQGILTTYKEKDVVSFPTMAERELMKGILEQKGDKVPHAIFAIDGSHLRCTGRNIAERRSKKYNWFVCLLCHPSHAPLHMLSSGCLVSGSM